MALMHYSYPVLSSLLPGLRDLRTPLAVGYLWMVALWLLLHDKIPKNVAEAPAGPIKSLYELGSLLGIGVVISAISFLAYLLGLMPRLQFFTTPSGIVLRFEGKGDARKLDVPMPMVFGIQIPMYFQLETFVSARLAETTDRFELKDHFEVLLHLATVEDFVERLKEPDIGPEHYDILLEEFYTHMVASELDIVSIQLQAKNRDFWDTYDRKMAEAQFRYGIALPLTAIICISSFQLSNAWWLLLLLVPVVLFWSATLHSHAAAAIVVQAVVLRIAEPPVLERLRAKLESLDGPPTTHWYPVDQPTVQSEDRPAAQAPESPERMSRGRLIRTFRRLKDSVKTRRHGRG
jgi:hypothetical protein